MTFGKKFTREDGWVFAAALLLNGVTAWMIAGSEHAAPEALIRTRLGEDLLMGNTVGRQGLICSVWFAPLPTLLLLPILAIPWSALHIVAPHLLSAVFGAIAVTYTGKVLRDFSVEAARFVILLFLALNPMVLLCSADGSSYMIFVGFSVAAIYYLLRWVADSRLRDLALLSLTTTLGAVTRQMGVLLAIAVVLVVALDLARRKQAAHQREGVLLLCVFPMLYVAALWLLFNWLIMGDALFFLRGTYAPPLSLSANRSPLWRVLTEAVVLTAASSPLFAVGLVVLAMVAWLRRDFKALALIVVAVVAPLFVGLLSWWAGINLTVGSSTSAEAVSKRELVLLVPLVCLLIGHLLRDATQWKPGWKPAFESATVVCVALLVFHNAMWSKSSAPESDKLRHALTAVVHPKGPAAQEPLAAMLKAHVLERSEAGRRFGSVKVFVCGFNGYTMFYERPRSDAGRIGDGVVFVNSLDFDFEGALRDYYRQDLFLLVPKPCGIDAFDSIHWRFPGIYEARNTPRIFFDSDWGNWRLFEIVKAPSEDRPRQRQQSAITPED